MLYKEDHIYTHYAGLTLDTHGYSTIQDIRASRAQDTCTLQMHLQGTDSDAVDRLHPALLNDCEKVGERAEVHATVA